MPQLSIPDPWTRRAALPLAFVLIFVGALLTSGAMHPDEPPGDSVGIIDGAAIAVSGPMRVEVINGLARTILRSGSDVRVKSGTARLELVEGGFISICGPAHFSVLKSGKLLTVALDTGSIHASIEREPALTIYTPQIQAQTIGIGDGPQDALVGFDEAGAMCIRAYRGAIRVEQQLTGQNVLIPQSGNVLLVNGELDNLRAGSDRCSCDPQVSKYAPPPPLEVSPQAATTEEARAKPPEAQTDIAPLPLERPASRDEPIYQVFMPPLVYDANATVQPEIDPNMIVLVRRVRVRPTLIFQGRVEGQAVAPATPPSAPSSAPVPSPPKAATPTNDSFVDRVRHFVRKLWSSGS